MLAGMDVSNKLEQLERELLTEAVRKDEGKIASLLADGFREFGSSGRVFDKAGILDALQNEISAALSMKAFRAEPLADNVVLVTYRAVREKTGTVAQETLRSSIWVRTAGAWQMVFHQGTRVNEPC